MIIQIKNYIGIKIIQNKELLNSIIILIAKPQSMELLEFNLNLIETKSEQYNYEKELKENNFYQLNKSNLNSYIVTFNKYDYILNNPSLLCIKNFILNINKQMKLDDFEINNYDLYKEYFNKIIDFNKMKRFLSIIFSSKTFKDAFEYLYPEYYKFPFNNKEEVFNFLEDYFYFIPYKNTKISAITDKFSLEIYYFLKKRKIHISQILNDELKQIIINILYRGSVVTTSCHEMNHDLYNILFKHSNGKIPLQTPRKKYIIERESGRNMEILLFDRKIYKLSLIECLYLLNEKNYNKNLQDFRQGFHDLNINDLIFDNNNIFKEFNKILDIDNFDNIGKNIIITCEENEDSNLLTDSYIDDIEDVNDVLGFTSDFSKL